MKNLRQTFCHAAKIDDNTEHEIWKFCGGGAMGDELAKLVRDGVKTATASAKIAYDTEGEELPGENDRSLQMWREVHRRAFTPDYEAAGLEFDEKGDCVLEEFEVVYR